LNITIDYTEEDKVKKWTSVKTKQKKKVKVRIRDDADTTDFIKEDVTDEEIEGESKNRR
jgi:hypothetical protein